jgi:uncharacterized protein (DUF1810 family)
MSDNIFSGQGTPTSQQQQGGAATPPTVPQNDPYADLLGSIKNERGEPKYKDVQTALDALKHSQEFIPNLKTENESMKAELERLRQEAARIKELEDTLARLSSGQQPPQQQTPATQGLDAEAVAKLVSQTIERQEKEKTAKQNTQTVTTKMVEVFGPEAEKVFYQKAQEFGLSVEQVNALAAQSPQAVFNLYGIGAATQPQGRFPAPSTGTVNTGGYQPQKQSHLGKNDKSVIIGASTDEVKMERERSKALVDELHSNGLTTYDLTDPKAYFRYFK